MEPSAPDEEQEWTYPKPKVCQTLLSGYTPDFSFGRDGERYWVLSLPTITTTVASPAIC
jgi:hypothetical protein